jgi:hypothetical protein
LGPIASAPGDPGAADGPCGEVTRRKPPGSATARRRHESPRRIRCGPAGAWAMPGATSCPRGWPGGIPPPDVPRLPRHRGCGRCGGQGSIPSAASGGGWNNAITTGYFGGWWACPGMTPSGLPGPSARTASGGVQGRARGPSAPKCGGELGSAGGWRMHPVRSTVGGSTRGPGKRVSSGGREGSHRRRMIPAIPGRTAAGNGALTPPRPRRPRPRGPPRQQGARARGHAG